MQCDETVASRLMLYIRKTATTTTTTMATAIVQSHWLMRQFESIISPSNPCLLCGCTTVQLGRSGNVQCNACAEEDRLWIESTATNLNYIVGNSIFENLYAFLHHNNIFSHLLLLLIHLLGCVEYNNHQRYMCSCLQLIRLWMAINHQVGDWVCGGGGSPLNFARTNYNNTMLDLASFTPSACQGRRWLAGFCTRRYKTLARLMLLLLLQLW